MITAKKLEVDANGAMTATLRAKDKASRLAWSALVNVLVAAGLAFTAVDNTALISEALAGLLRAVVGAEESTAESMVAGFSPVVRFFVYTLSLIALLVALHALLDYATHTRELGSVARSEARAWRSGGQRFYKGARSVALRRGTNFQRTVVIISRNLSFTQTNSASTPCFLFVHGSMARLGQFGTLMDLAERRGFGVFAYDQFGMGRSGGRYLSLDDGLDAHTSLAFSRDELLLDFFAFYELCCEEAGPDTPIIVCAHSFGCQLALELALNITDPLCFDMPGARTPAGLVLLGSQGPTEEERDDGHDKDDDNCPRETATASAKRLFRLPLFVLRLIRPLLSRGFKQRAFHADTVALVEGKCSTDGSNAVLEGSSAQYRKILEYATALSGANSMAVCKSFYTQTLGTGVSAKRIERQRDVLPLIRLMTGDSDRITPPECGRKMAELLGSTHIEIRLAGHQIMEEQPTAVFECLCEVAASLSIDSKKKD